MYVLARMWMRSVNVTWSLFCRACSSASPWAISWPLAASVQYLTVTSEGPRQPLLSLLVLELGEARLNLWIYHCWGQGRRRGAFQEEEGWWASRGRVRRGNKPCEDCMGRVTVPALSVQAPQEAEATVYQNSKKVF